MMPDDIRLSGDGVILREWTDDDLPAIVELFDDPVTQRFFPLAEAGPDLEVATKYLAGIRRRRAEGKSIHLAVTTDGERVLGEVIVHPPIGVLAGTIGAPYRGQGLATRAFRLLIDYAHDVLGVPTVLAQMEPDNHAMIAVMEGLGLRRTDAEPETWVERGRSVTVYTWAHHAE